jgi:DNA (cytosine-5)-methyltransferase 1
VVTVISTFAGCGGSSLGYKMAGFTEVLAIDWDNHAEKVFTANFPNVPFWNKDITKVSSQDILEFTGLKKGELDVLDGSPPCQGFSTSGKRNVTDKRNDLFKHFSRLVDGLQPKVFVMENVSGMVKGKMKGRFIEILKNLKSLNYNVKVKLLNAANYSVPQSRQRLFFIGVRQDLNKEPVFPKPHDKIITVGESLDMNIGIKSKYSENRYGDVLLNPNRPAPTLTKIGRLFLNKYKKITIEQAKILCSFPKDFKLGEIYSLAMARLGNAVMPKQMEAIATTIREEIL